MAEGEGSEDQKPEAAAAEGETDVERQVREADEEIAKLAGASKVK